MILVDAPRLYPGRRRGAWAHMVSDENEEELHRMARTLGLKRRWFRAGRFPHYDISLMKWRQALHQDVRCVTTRELVALFRARRALAARSA